MMTTKTRTTIYIYLSILNLVPSTLFVIKEWLVSLHFVVQQERMNERRSGRRKVDQALDTHCRSTVTSSLSPSLHHSLSSSWSSSSFSYGILNERFHSLFLSPSSHLLIQLIHSLTQSLASSPLKPLKILRRCFIIRPGREEVKPRLQNECDITYSCDASTNFYSVLSQSKRKDFFPFTTILVQLLSSPSSLHPILQFFEWKYNFCITQPYSSLLGNNRISSQVKGEKN